MKKIAVYTSFMNDTYRQKINTLASSLGYSVDYYNSSEGPDQLSSTINEYDIIFGHPPPTVLSNASSLRWLCSDFAGIEKYLDDRLFSNGTVLLSNSSGAYGTAISEHIIMVSLMLLRRMPEYESFISKKEWPSSSLTPIRSINGSHVVIVGTGDIGSNTARRMKALGASVTGVSRSGKQIDGFDNVLNVEKIDEILPFADIIVLALPETPKTKGLMSKQRIALLKKTAYLINVGRGSAIDQDALIEALNKREIAGAALDVMVPEPLPKESPLWDCPNIIITPHVSGDMALGVTCDLDVEMFCRDLKNFAEGKKLVNLVDTKQGY